MELHRIVHTNICNKETSNGMLEDIGGLLLHIVVPLYGFSGSTTDRIISL